MFNVIDEFLTDSNSWVEGIPFTLVPDAQNLTTYSLTPANGGQVKRLSQVVDKNGVVYPGIISDLNPPSATFQLTWPQNQTVAVTAMVVKSIILPNQHDQVPDAPSWLIPQYERFIEAGVVGRMQMHKAKSYSDATNGPINVKRLRDGIAMARTQALRAYLYGGQAWRFPRNFRTNSQRGGVSTPFPTPSTWGV
jgi:hypothetical protein